MKIMVVIPDLYASGGAEIFCLRVMREVSERGHEVHIITSSEVNREVDTKGITVHNEINRPWLLSRAPIDIARLARSIKPDVIHLMHAYPTAAWFWPFSYFYKGKVVCSAMGDDIQKNEDINYGIRTSKVKDFLIRNSLRRLDSLTVFGEGMVQSALNAGASDEMIEVINNPVPEKKLSDFTLDDIREKYDINTQKFNILYLGRFHEKKNVKELLEAAERLEDNFNILLVGKGQEEDELKSYVDENSISNVKFLGPIYGEEKLALYDLTDLLVLPSILEGMPTVLIEAARRDMCILASDILGNKYVTDQYSKGYSYQSGDSEDMKTKILELKEMKLDEKGSLESDFSLEKTVDKIIDLYS